MKITKTADGKYKLSKKAWLEIGRKKGWTKEAFDGEIGTDEGTGEEVTDAQQDPQLQALQRQLERASEIVTDLQKKYPIYSSSTVTDFEKAQRYISLALDHATDGVVNY